MGRGRAVVEDVAEMRVCLCRADFLTVHTGAEVFLALQGAWRNGLGETRPASAGIKLIQRAEERLATDHGDVDPSLMVVIVFISERGLCATFLSDVVLDGRELFFQLGLVRRGLAHDVGASEKTRKEQEVMAELGFLHGGKITLRVYELHG